MVILVAIQEINVNHFTKMNINDKIQFTEKKLQFTYIKQLVKKICLYLTKDEIL